MATLLAHVEVKPGMAPHWEDIARLVHAATHQHEPACRRYEYFRGREPNTYYVLLSFDDFDGFMTHQVADYHHDADFGDCFARFRLEWLDPVDGASGLGPSVTAGEVDPDRSERWNRYVERHSEPAPSWWEPLRR